MKSSDEKFIDYPDGTIVHAYGRLWEKVKTGRKRKRKSKPNTNGNENKN